MRRKRLPYPGAAHENVEADYYYPRPQALLARRARAVSRAIFNETPLFIARGKGALVEDVDGNEYVDFVGGVGALNVGHGSPEIINAVSSQVEQFVHVSFQIMMYEAFVALLERLSALTPSSFPKKEMCANSGAEGIENPSRWLAPTHGVPASFRLKADSMVAP